LFFGLWFLWVSACVWRVIFSFSVALVPRIHVLSASVVR
jgi:hypothetical protein